MSSERLQTPDSPFPLHVVPLITRNMVELPKTPESWNQYIVEPKLNGIRGIIYIPHQGDIRAQTKNNRVVTSSFPSLVTGFENLGKRHSLVLDGEIILGEGKTDYERNRVIAQSIKYPPEIKVAQIPFVYVAFDLLHYDGRNLTIVPIEERKKILRRLISEKFQQDFPIVVVASVTHGQEAFKNKVEAEGLEGIVLKRKGSWYRNRPNAQFLSPWYKHKFPKKT